MSGHSKWATIKRSKAANDSKRGKIFTKLGHEIALAVREGGNDTESNFRLRIVLDKARQSNMPKDNIERAIKRGSGEAEDGLVMEEYVYEGYGPKGTAIMVQAMTDNKNRTVAEVRHMFSRHGGNLGSEGSVAWMFSRKGVITIEQGAEDPEEIMLVAIDAGADDVEVTDDTIEVYTEMHDFKIVLDAISEYDYTILSSGLAWIPASQMALDAKDTIKNLKLLDSLEELDDVQEVYSNLDIDDEVMAEFQVA